MRYLNKIVFINSADKSIKYAEVNLDGNVHFIGTQGVGKSTLLRAILFFYNADKTKLGIPREKKNFDEYYLPYQNSYIIYEMATEHGAFCVLAFKTQGRTAFRFFNAAYNKRFFIDGEGKAFETWDKIREVFGKEVYYTRIIQSYEEYRNILYGNNKGLQAEFKKYAILESRQYQNIPRTISNVFLNANLSAEFVKETIIKSLHEEETPIDLATYSQNHLRDFEDNLNDIKKWTDKNRNGENAIEKQAERISGFYAALKHLEKRNIELAGHLGWAVNNVTELQPLEEEKLRTEELKLLKAISRLKELESFFEKKKEKILEQSGNLKGKIAEAKSKREEYDAMKIDAILSRVAKKNLLEYEQRNLLNEKGILSNNFLEIQQRYEALLKQLDNQLKEFENSRHAQRNEANSNLLQFKEELTIQFMRIFEDIRQQHKHQSEVANAQVREKENAATSCKIKRSEVRNTRFYEREIGKSIADITHFKEVILKSESEIQHTKEKIKNIEKEWLLEETGVKEDAKRKMERQNEARVALAVSIADIDKKLKNSKDSLYGWLNKQVPGWENNIGKVIDEENVLFRTGLNPKKIGEENQFYGIEIDTNATGKQVKTIYDYEREKEELNLRIQLSDKAVADINSASVADLEKLKRRFQPGIRSQKELIQNNEYEGNQATVRLDEAGVSLNEWKKKAEEEQQAALMKIDNEIERLSEEVILANQDVQKIESSISRLTNSRRKERDNKIEEEQLKMKQLFEQIDIEIERKRDETARKEAAIKHAQKTEMKNKGADTERITVIEIELSQIESKLIFIENSRDTVAEYNKDKRELFDKETEFKTQKSLLDKQLETEQSKHNQTREKLQNEIGDYNSEIASLKKRLESFVADWEAFKDFKKGEIFETIETEISGFSGINESEKSVKEIIDELKRNHYNSKDRLTELQEAVNKFSGNFQENNIFSFKTKFIDRNDYLEFAELLKEFIEEDKISEYIKRVEERFAHIIRQIGKETGELISKEGEIHGVITEINKDFVARNFVGAVKSMELRTVPSANRIFQLLVEIKKFNDENVYSIGQPNLFSTGNDTSKNEKAVSLLKQLVKEMGSYKEKEITLSDSFELQFRIVENDNDTDWVEKLTNVGSDGTDVLVKAMINILLLNVFKERAAKRQKDAFRLHCMMDEIGKLHPNNVKGILKFANERNIYLINSSPTSYNAADYKYTYILVKDARSITSVKRIVSRVGQQKTVEN